MKNELIAIPEFQERVSPLLDESRRFVLLELTDGLIVQRSTVTLSSETAALRIIRLSEMGVTSIICGAVSGYLARMISEKSLGLYSWVSGPVEDVMKAYLEGQLKPAPDCMKPCRGTGRSCGRGFNYSRQNITGKEKNL